MAVLHSCLLVFLLLLPLPSSLHAVSAAAEYMQYTCKGTTGSFTPDSAFAANLDRLVAALPSNASSSPSLFSSASVGSASDTAHGLALCRGDVTDPHACSSVSPTPSPGCAGSAARPATPRSTRTSARRGTRARTSSCPAPAPTSTTPPWSTAWASTRPSTPAGTPATPAPAASSSRSWARCWGRWPCTPPTTPPRAASPPPSCSSTPACPQSTASRSARRTSLGRGGFGPVYKGKLRDGTEIAVKRLAAHSGQGLEEFKNEIQLIAKLQHTNLVRLVGCCVQEEEKLLVYEYMPNRSLNCFIFDRKLGQALGWEQRRRVVEGVAQGLLYLHKHSRVRIIHRDLKASNILLDKDLNPKISDFGMARIFGTNMTEANTNRVVGTYGYMAPEYASEGIFSVKSDVYSFGVLLLEIVSGKRNSGQHHHYGDFINLLGYAWQLWREGRVLELIDPALGECGSGADEAAAMVRCVKVALLCVQDSAADRPTMGDVTAMLAAASDSASGALAVPDPKRPPHFSLRVAAATGSDDDDRASGMLATTQTHCTTSCSTNDLTITSIYEGR